MSDEEPDKKRFKSNESATEGETSNSEETNKSRIATAEEIADLMNHLDGFQYFEKLPAEIKVNTGIFILVYLSFQKMILCDHFNWIEHRKFRLVNKEFENICESNVDHFYKLKYDEASRDYNDDYNGDFQEHSQTSARVEVMLDCLTEQEYEQTDRRFDRHYYQTHYGYMIRSGKLVDSGPYETYVWKYDKKIAYSFCSTVAILAKQSAFRYFLHVLHNVSVECLHIIIEHLCEFNRDNIESALDDHPHNKYRQIKDTIIKVKCYENSWMDLEEDIYRLPNRCIYVCNVQMSEQNINGLIRNWSQHVVKDFSIRCFYRDRFDPEYNREIILENVAIERFASHSKISDFYKKFVSKIQHDENPYSLLNFDANTKYSSIIRVESRKIEIITVNLNMLNEFYKAEQ
ncbi:hypothetical protein WR25_21365 [Diploscapter pachys]|uniref:F-box domain-containing protein n=1 Tax=Diploscapter pachys TaxID=2018661 RepID=A0A2A2JJI7_9BILA|nr:hypothetical protein WR25_21365 [Diploscapter pachys]